jgi:transcriptional regulator GlxA family with amidase domain
MIRESATAKPRPVVMLVYPDAQILDVAGPLEVFARTARYATDTGLLPGPPYSVEMVARTAGPVVMSSGLGLVASRPFGDVGEIDTLLIAGGIGAIEAARDRELVGWIAERAPGVRRIASICTGALLLASAGLLRERKATTHWAYCDRLAAAEPGCNVDRDAIFVRDGKVYSSAGVTSGMDLALALVEEDLGSAVALAVAQELVLYVKRPGGQAQFSRHLKAQQRDDAFGALHLWMIENLDEPLDVGQLAARMGMSPRHFARRFAAAMGQTPAAYVAQLRLDHCRRRFEQGARNLKQVAREGGFGTEQNMRRTFQRTLGITPTDYLDRFTR